jgi:hypothetical protein
MATTGSVELLQSCSFEDDVTGREIDDREGASFCRFAFGEKLGTGGRVLFGCPAAIEGFLGEKESLALILIVILGADEEGWAAVFSSGVCFRDSGLLLANLGTGGKGLFRFFVLASSLEAELVIVTLDFGCLVPLDWLAYFATTVAAEASLA